ncbi:HAD family phosphatase [Reichenbachiella sp.]|uniref:HAD family hydrolase n=1 Tax=Reichenbachiella sp. TaxID=2184521 RepID=UPI003298537E
MAEIKNIIFDFGGVLIDWNPLNVYSKAFNGDIEKANWFLKHICTTSWNIEQDAGRSLADATELKINEFPEYEDLIRLYYDQWEDMLSGAIQGTVDILELLSASQRYRLYAITNWSAETFPIAQRKYEFLSWFEGIIVSGEVKMIKPAKDIFQHAFRTFKVTPESSIFIDDNRDNIDTANLLGMKGIWFDHSAQLKQELETLGVL